MNGEVWGIDFDEVESKRGGMLPPGRYKLEVVEARRDINVNQKPYVGVWCKVVGAEDEDVIGRVHYENRFLTDAAIPYTKAFFEDIGAAHSLQPNKGPSHAVGTLFEADVMHKSSKGPDGSTTTQAILQNIEPLGGTEDDAPEEEEEKETTVKRTTRRRG
jgi:hypothetical protein